MADRKAIEARIAELRGQLAKAEGGPTEVYSRIVGYYRSVRNWNAGKRQEYGERLAYCMPGTGDLAGAAAAEGHRRAEEAAERALEAAAASAVLEARQPEGAEPAPSTTPAERREEAAAPRAAVLESPEEASLREGVLVFTREACPNSPPVANYVVASGMRARFVDVDREEGLALARELGVLATPTVLGIDGEGRESFRAFDLKGLKSRVESPARA
jgi:hypothetical protein